MDILEASSMLRMSDLESLSEDFNISKWIAKNESTEDGARKIEKCKVCDLDTLLLYLDTGVDCQ
jgi:hypothetical protein